MLDTFSKTLMKQLLTKVKSVRFILTLWYSVVLLIAFGVFGGSIYVNLKHLLVESLRENLATEVDWIGRIVELERIQYPAGRPPDSLIAQYAQVIDEHFKMSTRNYIVSISTLADKIVYESENRLDRPLFAGGLKQGESVFDLYPDVVYNSIYILARRIDPFIIQVAYSDRPISVAMGHVVSIFVVLVPVVLLFSIAGGWLLAGIVLRPIGQITSMANQITAQNLNERVPTRSVNDELGELINTVNDMIQRLQDSFEQMRRFSMNIAHELRTPLTILKGESELALNKNLTPQEFRQLAATFLAETVHLSKLVDDLLTLAKADAGQMSIQKETVSLKELMEELYDDALILASQKELTVTLERNAEARVLGDATRLRQLFRNLLMNAVQYSEKGQSIALTSYLENGQVCISIKDTGIGIPTESIDYIFRPFYRVDPARSKSLGGSGLGLSIAKWITDAHQGTISVDSAPGKGSTFIVRIPLQQSGPHQNASS